MGMMGVRDFNRGAKGAKRAPPVLTFDFTDSESFWVAARLSLSFVASVLSCRRRPFSLSFDPFPPRFSGNATILIPPASHTRR